jgi:hypothetical protein
MASVGVGCLVGLAACRIVPQPEPVVLTRGPMPRTLAVVPALVADSAPQLAALRWLYGLDPALAARGHRLVAAPVVGELLAAATTAAPAAGPTAPGERRLADGCLQFVVRSFEVDGDDPLRSARWDVGWRVVATDDGRVVWNYDHRGSWRLAEVDRIDPTRALDAEPDYVPIGGAHGPQHRRVDDLIAWLHQHAMAGLPRGER